MKKPLFLSALCIILILYLDSICYSGSVISNISNRPYWDESPHLNNNGEVVWSGYDGTDWEIFLYDGTKTVQLTDNSYDDLFPQISDNGHVVWEGNPNTDNSEIFLYNGTEVLQLSNNPLRDFGPRINNKGHVVWYGIDGSGSFQIYLYDGTRVIQLTDTSYANVLPRINGNDYVAWYGWVSGVPWGGYQVYLYDGSYIQLQILITCSIPMTHQINESGHGLMGYDPRIRILRYSFTTAQRRFNSQITYDDTKTQLNNKAMVTNNETGGINYDMP
jgi:hypothetical protein